VIRLAILLCGVTLVGWAGAGNGPFPGGAGSQDVTGLSWDPDAGNLYVATASGRAFVIAGPAFEGAARARLSATSLDFGGVVLGDEAILSSRVSNPGALEVTISALSEPDGAFARLDAVDSCPLPPFPLPSGQSCLLSYRFQPTAAGDASATLNIGNDGVDGDLMLALSGTGLEAGLALSSGQLDFGSPSLDGAPILRELILTNSGNTDLTMSSIEAATAPFSGPTEASSCAELPLVLSAGSSCSLVYTFAPDAPGTFAQGLAIVSSAGSRAFSLLGQALPASAGPPDVIIEPRQVIFGAVALGTVLDSELIRVEHLGGDTLSIGNIVVVEQSGGQFEIPGNSDFCSQRSLAAGQSCAFRVRMTPDQIMPGPFAEIELESNAAAAPLKITVLGSGGELFGDRFEALLD